jgi:hypothetical protein
VASGEAAKAAAPAGPRYVVGIDLGTTNSALAYVDTQAGGGGAAVPADPLAAPAIQVLKLPQLTAPGEVGEPELLPSFLYIPGPHELPAGSLALPWAKDRAWAVGELARNHGAQVGHRLVSSAKSWLCHADVDRRAAILPWGAAEGDPRISPLESSSRFLSHLREAWNHAIAGKDGTLTLEKQHVVLTVPASFDAVARELTVEAARMAGLPSITLLEEPQAAFYSWLSTNPLEWRELVKVGDVVLVCDVGGGTTDFCLIAVAEAGGTLELTRVAVGNHLLLGGDNMDLALALAVDEKLGEAGKSLDSWQLNVLVHQCRQAKEMLLGEGGKSEAPLVIPGRGSSVVGGTIKAKLARAELDALLVDGFFPECSVKDRPDETAHVGLQEFGLPYAPDAGVTRWLARFLSEHRKSVPGGGSGTFAQPTAILFNGGVLRPKLLRERILSVVSDWVAGAGGDAVRELPNEVPTLAVARGAAYYGMVRQGQGVRIRGGAARSYYIGVEAARPAVPGVPAPLTAWCVLPRGVEEGASMALPGREFGLVVGQTARFRFFSSATRPEDGVGTPVTAPERNLQEIEPLTATLPAREGARGRIPVQLNSALTEMGVLELSFLDRDKQQQCKLEFSVREKPNPEAGRGGKSSSKKER